MRPKSKVRAHIYLYAFKTDGPQSMYRGMLPRKGTKKKAGMMRQTGS